MSDFIIELIAIIIFIIIDFKFAQAMQEIVKEKGHNKSYFLWCLFLPLHGFMLVNSLPDRKNSTYDTNSAGNNIEEELPDL